MKKHSRRSFGKQLTGALAALPIATLTTRIVSAQEKTQTKARGGNVVDIRTSHDTPPPILLMSGSLIVEARTDKTDWNRPIVVGGAKRRKHLVPTKDLSGGLPTKPIFIAHIKIIDGSGEMLYRLDNDVTKAPITVSAKMNKTELTTITVEGEQFAIETPDLRRVDHKANDPSMDPTGKRQRVRYLNDAGSDTHELTTIEVANDKDLLYRLPLANLKDANEVRVMIWWEEL